MPPFLKKNYLNELLTPCAEPAGMFKWDGKNNEEPNYKRCL